MVQIQVTKIEDTEEYKERGCVSIGGKKYMSKKRNKPTEQEIMRYDINRRMIGEEVFVIDFGGYYGFVEEVDGDEFLVKNGEFFNWVNIHSVRQPRYFV